MRSLLAALAVAVAAAAQPASALTLRYDFTGTVVTAETYVEHYDGGSSWWETTPHAFGAMPGDVFSGHVEIAFEETGARLQPLLGSDSFSCHLGVVHCPHHSLSVSRFDPLTGDLLFTAGGYSEQTRFMYNSVTGVGSVAYVNDWLPAWDVVSAALTGFTVSGLQSASIIGSPASPGQQSFAVTSVPAPAAGPLLLAAFSLLVAARRRVRAAL